MNPKLALLTASLFILTPLAFAPSASAQIEPVTDCIVNGPPPTVVPGNGTCAVTPPAAPAPIGCTLAKASTDILWLTLCQVAENLTRVPGVTVTLEKDVDQDGREDLANVTFPPGNWTYLQLDFFYSPPGSSPAPMGTNPAAFDVWVSGVMLYNPSSGQPVNGPPNTMRLTNLYNGEIGHLGLYLPVGTASDPTHYGQCQVCIDTAAHQIAVQAGPGTEPSNPSQGMLTPSAGGFAIDVDPTIPGTINPANGPSVAYLRLGSAPVSNQALAVWPDGKQPDLTRLHIKPEASNFDDDQDTDLEELLCPGGVSTNPFNPQAHCADYDGDGLANLADSDPYVPFQPFALQLAPGQNASGEAPFSPSLVCVGSNSSPVVLHVGQNQTITCTNTPSDASKWFTVGTPLLNPATTDLPRTLYLNQTGTTFTSTLGVTVLGNSVETFAAGFTCIAVNGDATKCGTAGAFPTTDPDPLNFTSYQVAVAVNHTIVEGSQYLQSITSGGVQQNFAAAPVGNYSLSTHVNRSAASPNVGINATDSGGARTPAGTGTTSFAFAIPAEIVPNAAPTINTGRNLTVRLPVGPVGPLGADDPTASAVAFEVNITDSGPVNRSVNSTEPTSGANAIKVMLQYRTIGATGNFLNVSMGLGAIPTQCKTGAASETVLNAIPAVPPPAGAAPVTAQGRDGFTNNTELFCTTLPWTENGYEYRFTVTDSGNLSAETGLNRTAGKSATVSVPPVAAGCVLPPQVDSADPFDTNGNGTRSGECNNQIDLVENLVFYIDPDELTGTGDKYAGKQGATLHVRHAQANLVPRSSDDLVVRVGDANSTKRATEILVVDDYLAGTTTCLYTAPAKVNGNNASKLYAAVANTGKFSGAAADRHPCGTPVNGTARLQTVLDNINNNPNALMLNLSVRLVDTDGDGLPNAISVQLPDPTKVVCTPTATPSLTCVFPAGTPINQTLPGYDADPPAMTVSAGGPYNGLVNVPVPIQATATNGVGTINCAWSNKTGESGAVFGNPSSCSTNVTYSSTGPHNITVVVTDGQAQTEQSTASVTIDNLQTLVVDAGAYSGAQYHPIAIAANITGGLGPFTCAWTGTGAVFENAAKCATNVTFASNGTMSIQVNVTDSQSTPVNASDPATVTVGAPLPLEAKPRGPYTGTSGQAIAINGTGFGGKAPYSCAWSSNGTVTFGSASACSTTATYTGAGAYNLTLTVTDSLGGTATNWTTVTVAAPACAAGGPTFPSCAIQERVAPCQNGMNDTVFACSKPGGLLALGLVVSVLGVTLWL